MKTISRYIMTLALLLTAVTGAWAEDYTTVFELNGSTASVGKLTLGSSSVETSSVKIHENTDEIAGIKIYGDYIYEGGKYFTIAPETGSFKKGDKVSIAVCFNNSSDTKSAKAVIYADDHETLLYTTAEGINGRTTNDDPVVEEYVLTQDASVLYIGRNGTASTFVTTLKVERPASAEPDIEVKWDAATKTGTFVMPAFDVEIAPIYAPVAQWAKVENVDQIPTAIDGIIAGEAKDIVKAGTVAKVGSTENVQGTLMYLVTTTKEQPTSTTGFSATVPTGAVLTGSYAEDQTVYVWYYIKGIDAAEGVTPTAENTFNDSEICAEPIKVTVLSNKFDITFKAANDNTIKAGKATVTVGGTAATVTEGKLQGVKMGTEVKVKANTGYKFRKVEVKKKASAPSLNITNPAVGQVIGSDGKNYAYGSLPTGVTAVAKICYVSGSNGLALALADEETYMNWSTAQTVCAAHTPAFTGGTWKLPSKDEWDNMITAAGSYTALRDGFSSVGGTNMQSSNWLWSSTESDSDNAWLYDFNYGNWMSDGKDYEYYFRACLAF